MNTSFNLSNFPNISVDVQEIYDDELRFISKLTATEDYLMAAVLIVTGVVGGGLNLLVLVVSYNFRKSLKPMEMYIVNVALNDLLMVVLLYPLTVPSCLQHHWTTGPTGCDVYGFMGSILGLGSIYTLTVMAIARYLKMCVPRYHDMTTRSVTCSVLTAEVAALFWATSPLVGWGRYAPEPHGTSCTVAWGLELDTSYSICLLLMGLGVPVFFIVWSYASIMSHIRGQGSTATQWADIRMTKMSFLICMGFLLAWFPYAAVCFAEIVHPGLVTPRVSAAPALFAKSASVHNPLIYFLSSKKFRMQTRDLFSKFRSRFRRVEPVLPDLMPSVILNHQDQVKSSNDLVMRNYTTSPQPHQHLKDPTRENKSMVPRAATVA